MTVREATLADVPAMVDLLERRRAAYQHYQPVFWKKAADSAEMSKAFLPFVMGKPETVALAADQDGALLGFLIATPTPAPPVYDVPGPTYTVDDFAVAAPEHWASAGQALLSRIETVGRQRGWAQIVVVSALRDLEKSTLLESGGLTIASTWWTLPLTT